MSVQSVRDCSVTGEFDDLDAAKIDKVIELICPKYKTARQKNVSHWRELVRLHVAHYLSRALSSEGQGGGGPVTSETFAQVGSRSYAAAPLQGDGSNWWTLTSYGELWYQYWIALPPGMAAPGL